MAESATDLTNLRPPKKKAKLKSAVWDYFGYPPNAREDGNPICNQCGRKVAAKGGNTSNLLSHLREHHPAVQLKLNEALRLCQRWRTLTLKVGLALLPGSTASGELTTALLKDVLIASIREEISTLRVEFIAELRSSHASLTTSINSLSSKVRDIETAATDTDKRIAELETTCETLDSDNRRLREETDDLENRSRRNKLHFIAIPEGAEGIPEESEGSQPTMFMGSFFTELFGASKLPNPPEIDRPTELQFRSRSQMFNPDQCWFVFSASRLRRRFFASPVSRANCSTRTLESISSRIYQWSCGIVATSSRPLNSSYMRQV
ncbi:hypothetical protein SRHO_G00140340 [Serrasalmus rhombeus]